MRFLLLVLPLVCGCPAGRAPLAPPDLAPRWETYDVTGSTVADLRRALDRHGPLVGGDRRDAATVWWLAWDVRVAPRGGACATEAIETSLEVTIRFPTWAGDGPPDVIATWERYIAAVREHELAHAAIAGDARERLKRALAGVRPAATCDALIAAIDATGRALIDETRRRQDAFDRRTRHGRTRGVRLP